MTRQWLTGCLLLAIPVSVYARAGGAPIRRSGVPGEDAGQTCTACHRDGGASNSDTRGKIEISASPYTPGTKQTLSVTVFHPEAVAWGFQLTVRSASDALTKVGVLTPNDEVQVLCDPSGSSPCEAAAREFATHRSGAVRTGSNGSKTFQVEWTPTANASGDVVIYAAGNAANGGSTNAGDRIYSTSLRVIRAITGPPTITSAGVIQPGDFGAKSRLTSGSWIEIYGQNVATSMMDWSGKFLEGNAPTTLDDVEVKVGDKKAFLRYVSPGQVNAQLPDGLGEGPVQMVLTTKNGSSNANITTIARAPALWAPGTFKSGDRQYVGAQINATTYALPEGLVTGITSRPARPGETVVLYGVGFGTTTPAIPAGAIATVQAMLPDVVVRIGGIAATVAYAGVAPQFVGLYQFNVTVPQGVSAGDASFEMSVAGISVDQVLRLAVGM